MRYGNFRGMPLFVADDFPADGYDGCDLLRMEPRGGELDGEHGPILDGWITSAENAALLRTLGGIDPWVAP